MADRRAVLLVSHGSRQPHGARFAQDVATALRHDDPGLVVAVSFLELNRPSPGQALQQLVANGQDEIQVVPLLFSAGYHYRVDVPAALDAVREFHPELQVRTAAPLLTDAETDLIAALDTGSSQKASARTRSSAPPDGLVLLAAGSGDPRARAQVNQLARAWGRQRGLPSDVAFCDLHGADVRAAIARLRARGAQQVVCGSLFLAAGRLLDAGRRAALEAGAGDVAGPLGTTPALLELIRRRCLEPAAAG